MTEQVGRTPPRDGTVPLIPEDSPCESPIEHLMPLLDGMSGQLGEGTGFDTKYQGIFAISNGELAHTTVVQHTLDTGNSRPIKQPPRRMPLPQREIADREVDKMMEKMGTPASALTIGDQMTLRARTLIPCHI